MSDWKHHLRRHLAPLRLPPEREMEIIEELSGHLDDRYREMLARGLTEAEALRAVLSELSRESRLADALQGVEREATRETAVRGTRKRNMIADLRQDLRYGMRVMAKSPGFTLVVILSLALGIGANTAIFSLLDAVLLKSLPVAEPAQLIELLTVRGAAGAPFNAYSYQALEHLRDHNQSLAGLLASSRSSLHATVEGGAPERLSGQYVTGNYFSLLGVPMLLGRPLALEDDRMGAGNAVAVISHRIWQGRFGGTASAIGRQVMIEKIPFTIVGVAPPSFFGIQVGAQTDIWIPLAMEPRLRQPSWTSSAGYKWLQLLGRRKPGVSSEEARADLAALFQRVVIDEELSLAGSDVRNEIRNWSLVVEEAGGGLSQLRRQFSKPLRILMLVVGAVLLIACANVANLLLARARVREKEMAIRLALGAERSRLIRQLVTESLMLSAAGGILGLFLAYWASSYLISFLSSGRLPVRLEVEPDARLLAFTLGVSFLTGILFGLVPALRATRTDCASALKGGGGGNAGRKGYLLSRALVVAQMAMLVVLVLGAGLFLRSLYNLKSIDLGFEGDRVLQVALDPTHSGYSGEQLRALYGQMLERLEATPGVESASLSWITPITGGGSMRSVWIDGDLSREAPNTYLNWVAPKYFATLGTPLVAGRDFARQDAASGVKVAIVNETFARRHFGAASPLGKRVMLGRDDMREIVGVAGDAKYLEMREATPPTIYLHTFQEPAPSSLFVIRTSSDPERLALAVRREIQAIAGNIAITDLKTLARQVDASIVEDRLLATLAAFFGALSLLLAAIGLYGVISYGVARRTREIGIRIALGATPAAVIGMVLRETIVLVVVGLGVGLPAALSLRHWVASLLYGLTPADPVVLSVSLLTLFVVAAAAGLWPARRAARVDPIVALRQE